MRILLAGMMALLLLRAPETMAAAEAACALFVRSVMPGLFPYLTLSQMLVSRCGRDMQPGLLMLLGWCGGSPTGARLLAMQGSRLLSTQAKSNWHPLPPPPSPNRQAGSQHRCTTPPRKRPVFPSRLPRRRSWSPPPRSENATMTKGGVER